MQSLTKSMIPEFLNDRNCVHSIQNALPSSPQRIISVNSIDYVFPNIRRPRNCRGGLAERWELAGEHGCSYIEMPAPFVYNNSEKKITGQRYGEFFTPETMSLLYTEGKDLPGSLKYILHTDPGFDNTSAGNGNSKGFGYNPKDLKWYDRTWVESYARMLAELAGYLGTVPHTIEIHPGSPKNNAVDYVLAMHTIRTIFEDQTGQMPEIVLENLTASHVYSGAHLSEIAEFLEASDSDLAESCGFVVDISGIWTANKQDKEVYSASFDAIPLDFVRGLHIHLKHQSVDEMENPPFWAYFREWFATIDHPIFINPEVHTMKSFLTTYPYLSGTSKRAGIQAVTQPPKVLYAIKTRNICKES